tara:strand:+ start:7194 stop:7370 length:177 start_codon:yes stop_codon:yes gene_type:complete
MYGPKKRVKRMPGGMMKKREEKMPGGMMKKREQANMGRLVYNEGGMYSHGEMPKAKAN